MPFNFFPGPMSHYIQDEMTENKKEVSYQVTETHHKVSG